MAFFNIFHLTSGNYAVESVIIFHLISACNQMFNCLRKLDAYRNQTKFEHICYLPKQGFNLFHNVHNRYHGTTKQFVILDSLRHLILQVTFKNYLTII